MTAGRCHNCVAELALPATVCAECGAAVEGALAGVRILDLTGPDHHYCGQLMANLGADVAKIEPPAGDAGRSLKPFAGPGSHPENGIPFLAYNTNKRSVVLDFDSDSDLQQFRDLTASADVLLDDGSLGDLAKMGLSYAELASGNPRLVHTSITPFGLDGPYAGYLGGELIVQALGGLMYGFGDPDVRPALAPLGLGSTLTAQHAAFASLTALRYRRRSGRGQHVGIAAQDVLANILAYLSRYASGGQINRRPGASSFAAPTNTYPTKDGFIYMQPGYPRHVEALFQWTENPELLEERWNDREYRRGHGEELTRILSEFTQGFTKMEFAHEAQRRHIPCHPLMTVQDIVEDEHLRSREFFVEVDHPKVGVYRAPRGPAVMSEGLASAVSAAPKLGEHTTTVFEQWANDTPSASPEPKSSDLADDSPLPLEGLRILDFSRVWAGPYMTRYLAELGAEVIKVESNMLPDRQQARGNFAFNFGELNRSKRSITLNMRHPEARSLAEGLIGASDVVVENFRSGVLDNWGLGYPVMKEINPQVVYLTMPGMGHSGPRSSDLSYGQSLLAYTGIMNLWAHPESPGITRPKVPLPDCVAAATGAFAVLAALEQRDRTGRGQMIELAQLEGLSATAGVAFLDYFLNGEVWTASGNRSLNFAPHDVYPCLGHDAWCAIACYTNDQWAALCRTIDRPELTEDSRFVSVEARQENIDDLDAVIIDWTVDRTPRQVMRTLQEAGVPAGVVSSGEDLYFDVNLRARDYLVTVDHGGEIGLTEHPGTTVRLSLTPGRVRGPCPELGEHNVDVFGRLLDLSPEEIRNLEKGKVIY